MQCIACSVAAVRAHYRVLVCLNELKIFQFIFFLGLLYYKVCLVCVCVCGWVA